MELIFVMWTIMAMFSCNKGICAHEVGPVVTSRQACEALQKTLTWTGPAENLYCAPVLPPVPRPCDSER